MATWILPTVVAAAIVVVLLLAALVHAKLKRTVNPAVGKENPLKVSGPGARGGQPGETIQRTLSSKAIPDHHTVAVGSYSHGNSGTYGDGDEPQELHPVVLDFTGTLDGDDDSDGEYYSEGADATVEEVAAHYQDALPFDTFVDVDSETTQLAEKLGSLGFDLQDVPGDGDCIFHAVSMQLSPKDRPRTVSELREAVVRELTRHPTEYGGFPGYKDAAKLREYGVWDLEAGNLVPVALAAVLRRVLIIHTVDSTYMVTPLRKTNVRSGVLRLGYLNQRHYAAVVEKEPVPQMVSHVSR